MKINLLEKAKELSESWQPGILANLNNHEVKLAKFSGAFTWHSHADTDELFYVVEGAFTLELRTKSVHLTKGEMIVVPKGVEHRPIVEEGEAIVLLFEQAGTVNTGNNPGELTFRNPKKI